MKSNCLFLSARLTLGLLAGALVSPASRAQPAAAPVTITEDAALYTLDNGLVRACVAKASGDLVSLRYKNTEMLATFLTPDGQPDLQRDPPGANPNGLNRGMTDHQYGFWSHDAMGPRGTGDAIARITIDPKTNGGARGEVSVKGSSKGRKMGTGPGASPQGQFAADVESAGRLVATSRASTPIASSSIPRIIRPPRSARRASARSSRPSSTG